jgi:beta-glucosidase-like glycosyl hydrolase/CubicO group peptidase (beta-lactamase class C family)
MKYKVLLFFLLSLSCRLLSFAQDNLAISPFWATSNVWVDSVFNSLTEEERIAQLFMIAAWSSKDSAHIKEISCLVQELKIGGLIFFKGGPVRQALLTNYYQSLAKVPLLIGIDGEWGLSMRLDSTPTFPRQMVLGSANEDTLVFLMGKEIGKQCRRMGIHLNFAPVVDVNNNPRNPVINDRSFGEDKYKVARMGVAYSRGIQSEQVMACAKHFPGHGDTDSDSHYSLPIIKKTLEQLDTLELYPFRELFKNGVMSVMNAHLFIPSLDSTPNLASSISPVVVDTLLKKRMGFQGLVLTDALNMQGVSKFNTPWDINIKALQAGNDMLLFPEQVPLSILKIKEAMDSGWLDRQAVYASIKKVLLCKQWVGLDKPTPVDIEHLVEDLNCCSTNLLIRSVIEKSVVIAKNQDGLIPVKDIEKRKIALVGVGSNEYRTFEEVALSYARMDRFFIDKNDPQNMYENLFESLKTYDLVIVSLHNTSRFVNKNFGLSDQEIRFINKLNLYKKIILVNNGNPYSMQFIPNIKSLIISYEDLPWNNEIAAQILFGARTASGKLPVGVGEYTINSSNTGNLLNRLTYVLPDQLGYDSKALSSLDTLVNRAINAGAIPGCQLLVSKNGQVIYHKAFGYQTYDKTIPVKGYHLYDVASLTKILSTTLAAMKLHEKQLLDLDRRVGHYVPELRETNKRNITIRQLLLHESGLPAFIPFYKKTLVNGYLNPLLYCETQDSFFCIPVAKNLWLHKDYQEVIWDEILSCDIKKEQGYVYSDLNMILLKKAIENITRVTLDVFVDSVFYRPLGLATIGYKPLERFPVEFIAPTESDSLFRKQLLQGYVHDPGAALMGGVAGHAGVFSNANDVTVIMQMLLNKGEYGGVRFLKPSSVDEFTVKSSKISRRGLGFDKPETSLQKASPCSKRVSPATFGHTGFTGTCTWADPQSGIIFVFLSNRVNPSAENNKIIQMNLRTDIQDLIYQIINP